VSERTTADILRARAAAGRNGQAAAGGKKSIATRLVELVEGSGANLFHAPDQVAYIDLQRGRHRETWPLKSTGFRRWLAHLFYETEGKSAGSQAVADALGVLEGKALFCGEEHPVFVRLAEHGGRTYLDLADPEWRVVEVDQQGWKVTASAPVRFRRTKGTLPLPAPQKGGSLNDLRPFVNVRDEGAWLLLLGWVVAALRPRGPFPLLTLCGEQGSAKSTAGKFLQRLLDPSGAELRSEPKEPRDLMIAAAGSWLVAYDNLSYLPPWLSNALCRLATGGGFGTRQLYTDDEEMLFNAKRPALLTSIEDVVTAADLLDRAVLIHLTPIPDTARRTEEDLDAQFERAKPRLLGAALDAVSAGLRTLGTVRPKKLPRMADFALWAEACLRGAGHKADAFFTAYEANRKDVNALSLEASPVAQVLLRLLAGGPMSLEGTAGELLERLNGVATDTERKQKGWPAKGHVLSGQLRRAAPNLRRAGVEVEFTRDRTSDRTRRVSVRRTDKNEEGETASEASRAPCASDAEGAGASEAASETPGGGVQATGSVRPSVQAQEASGEGIGHGSDALDASDAATPPLSCDSYPDGIDPFPDD
jgi:hypothetical protein